MQDTDSTIMEVMMEVESIYEVCSEIIEFMKDGIHEWATYRRNSDADWEVLVGDSWESVNRDEEELEEAYQKYINEK